MSTGTVLTTGRKISGLIYTPELAHRITLLRERHAGAKEQWEKPSAVLIESTCTFPPAKRTVLGRKLNIKWNGFCDTLEQAQRVISEQSPTIVLSTTNFVLGGHNPAVDLAREIRNNNPATLIAAIQQGEFALNRIERRLFDLVFQRIPEPESACEMIKHRLGRAKVAIFDDETSIVDFYYQELHDHVRIVSQRRIEDVEEALRISRLAKPDIIVIDLDWTKDSETGKRRDPEGIYLPEGLEFISRLRLESPETIVILQSASVNPADQNIELERRIESAGFDALYKKYAGEKIVRTVLHIAHEITQEERI